MEASPKLANAATAAAWCNKHIKKVVASLASQGHIDANEALRLQEGIESVVEIVGFCAKFEAEIKAAARGAK